MALKLYKPVTNATRGLVSIDRKELYKGKPEKSLTVGLTKTGGRNNLGRITAWRHAGGHKRKYRIIDFKRAKHDMKAVVLRLEYDPNRTAFIALIRYEDGELSYILAPHKLSVGSEIVAGERCDIKPGNAMRLRNIPIGSLIHNVELKAGKGGQLSRSAGSYVQLVGKDAGQCLLKLRSGEVRYVSLDCYATIGTVSNPDNQNTTIGKAGRSRWKGIRPGVRGVAMNPVDHPLGGGEGKTAGGRCPVTPWGKPTKGMKTRNNKRTNKSIVKRRNAK